MSQTNEGEFYNTRLGNEIELPPVPEDTEAQPALTGPVVSEVLKQSAHPGVLIFHLLFKIGSVISYLLLGWMVKSFVIQFVVTVTLLAFDFWTVKNITGRFLVGLRWWSDLEEDGTTKWRFESIEDPSSLNQIDGTIFWGALYVTPLVWILLGVVCILKFNFSWLLVVIVALVLSISNLVGYFKCSKDAKEKLQNYVGQQVFNAAVDNYVGKWGGNW